MEFKGVLTLPPVLRKKVTFNRVDMKDKGQGQIRPFHRTKYTLIH